MTELKTLKDIYVRGQLSRDNLKEEAIKWVKEFYNKFDELSPIKKSMLENQEAMDFLTIKSTITWIKHFFNLTEEDLK